MNKNIKAIYSEKLSNGYDKRYVLVNIETGEIIDDAQGYGYRTPQKAFACYAYKNRDKSKDSEKRAKEEKIKKWMKNNKSFIKAMDTVAFEIAKGSWGPNDKFDAKLVRKMLKENDLQIDFTAEELLRVWKKS